MGKYASAVVSLMESWVGKKESDGSHKSIIDIYNSYKPHPRGYKVKYTDSWCATTVSAAAIKLGYTDIIPIECGCGEMIELAKKMGIWIENENRVPNPGEFVLYDWDDNKNTFKATDNKGWPEHVGVVVKVIGNKIRVAEGNINDAVGYRDIEVNGWGIRGYITPKYDAEPTTSVNTSSNNTTGLEDIEMPTIENGSTGKAVGVWQVIVGAKVDMDFGSETEAKTIVFQKKAFPNQPGEWDGVVGPKTWRAGLESV